jgi:hypothetical protein
MSAVAERKLKAVKSPRKLRSVEVAQRAEADSWALADAIYEDVADLAPVDRSMGSENTGLYGAVREVTDALEAAGLDFKETYVRQLWHTRKAWPPEERVPQASFTAHYLLRAQTYDGKRKQRLERLLKQSKSGHVTAHAVKVWISESKPRHTWTFLQLVEKRIRGSVKGAAAPWHLVAEEDRQAIATILHRVGNEVADGTFPPKANA